MLANAVSVGQNWFATLWRKSEIIRWQRDSASSSRRNLPRRQRRAAKICHEFLPPVTHHCDRSNSWLITGFSNLWPDIYTRLSSRSERTRKSNCAQIFQKSRKKCGSRIQIWCRSWNYIFFAPHFNIFNLHSLHTRPLIIMKRACGSREIDRKAQINLSSKLAVRIEVVRSEPRWKITLAKPGVSVENANAQKISRMCLEFLKCSEKCLNNMRKISKMAQNFKKQLRLSGT